MYFIPLRVSKERTLSVVGGKGGGIPGQTGAGGGTGDGNKAGYGSTECRVREAQHSHSPIHLLNLSL